MDVMALTFRRCHCGCVRFEVLAPAEIEASECNCSICSKTGFLHLIVPKSRFSLLQGSEFLTAYTFNTGVAQHLFCKICGIKSFYVPRSIPTATRVQSPSGPHAEYDYRHRRSTEQNWGKAP